MRWEKMLNKEKIEKLFAPLEQQALSDLARLVNTNSFTANVEGLAAAGDVIVDIAAKNGLPLEKIPAGGDVLGAHHLVGEHAADDRFFGIVGHFDTVHPPDSPFETFSDRGSTLVGPGVQDMKSGIVAAIYGLRVAREALGLDRLPVKIVFNCDEETGSIDSRPLIEKVMIGARAVFIFEGRHAADGAVVTSRKGIIMGHMTVTGRAAHAGEAPEEGASAIVEAAHKIVALDALTDFQRGTLVTTGKIDGGEVANQIPGNCTATIDIRFRTGDDEEEIKAAIERIMAKTHVPGCTTEYALQTARPPFVRGPETEALWQRYRQAATEFGVPVAEREAGGGSDGNLTAAIGVPTIDGVGPAGEFAHTRKEYIQKASFFEAVKVFSLLLANWIEK
jgi:glutamate carboxypeptidase